MSFLGSTVPSDAVQLSMPHGQQESLYGENQKRLVAFIRRTSSLVASVIAIPGLAINGELKYKHEFYQNFLSVNSEDCVHSCIKDENSDKLYSILKNSAHAQSLSVQLEESRKHLQRLEMRVLDRTCRILVTGDLNSGKSTFINALLRRPVLPTDQQPLTCVFTEVIDSSHNKGDESVQYVPSLLNPTEHSVYPLSSLAELVTKPPLTTDETNNWMPLARIFCHAPSSESVLVGSKLVDVRLIDSPGLNRDVVKTLSLVSRQREIDVIVFAVCAENHFTLSSREFLSTAAAEKSYIFVIVTKFDKIRNKEACKNSIFEQIKELSPHTHSERERLVHFVSLPLEEDYSNDKSNLAIENESVFREFTTTEHALKDFILAQRSASKLSPVKVYLDNMLGDVCLLLDCNLASTQERVSMRQAEILAIRPLIADLTETSKKVHEELENSAREVCSRIETLVSSRFSQLPSVLINKARTEVEYPGLRSLGVYLRQVRDALVRTVHTEIEICRALASEEIKEAWEEMKNSQKKWQKATNAVFSSSVSDSVLNSPEKSIKLQRDGVVENNKPDVQNLRINGNKSILQIKDLKKVASTAFQSPQLAGHTPRLSAPSISSLNSLFPASYACTPSGFLFFKSVAFAAVRQSKTNIRGNAADKQASWWRSWVLSNSRNKISTASLIITGSSYLSSAVAARLLCGEKLSIQTVIGVPMELIQLLSRVGYKKVGIIAITGISVAVVIYGARFVMQLAERVPEYMTCALLEHLDESRYSSTLQRHVCESARETLDLALYNITEAMGQDKKKAIEHQKTMEAALIEARQALDAVDEIKGRSDLLRAQVKEIIVEIS